MLHFMIRTNHKYTVLTLLADNKEFSDLVTCTEFLPAGIMYSFEDMWKSSSLPASFHDWYKGAQMCGLVTELGSEDLVSFEMEGYYEQ